MKENPPDWFDRPDGWYRSEYLWYRLQGEAERTEKLAMCFAIKDRTVLGRSWEFALEANNWAVDKRMGSPADPRSYRYMGALDPIANLHGDRYKNDWDDDLELV